MKSLRNASAVALSALISCFALVLAATGGCAKPATKARAIQPESSPEKPSEAAKTRALEEKAAGYEERYREIQEGDLTADEKAKAVGDLVDEQQRTVRAAEDGDAGESEDDSQE